MSKYSTLKNFKADSLTLAKLAALAAEWECSESEVIRRLIAMAANHLLPSEPQRAPEPEPVTPAN